jgi:XTP/dITP diphosphohydrolase
MIARMKQLLLATHNQHKAEELRAMLNDTTIRIVTLDQFPHVKEIVEDQDTLEGNALKKASEVFRSTRLPSLADDTGLEVAFLNGEPGVYSARYAGPQATYSDNVEKLLDAMRGVEHREARFRCVLAFVAPDVQRTVTGECSGVITEKPRGTGGFGYDPIFLPTGCEQTFAEMSLELKNTLSHRTRALQQMRGTLLEYFR